MPTLVQFLVLWLTVSVALGLVVGPLLRRRRIEQFGPTKEDQEDWGASPEGQGVDRPGPELGRSQTEEGALR